MKIGPIKNCTKISSKFWRMLNEHFTKWPNCFNVVPKRRNFAKSGHTDRDIPLSTQLGKAPLLK